MEILLWLFFVGNALQCQAATSTATTPTSTVTNPEAFTTSISINVQREFYGIHLNVEVSLHNVNWHHVSNFLFPHSGYAF